MRRDLVGWTFALAVSLVVLLSFVPAFAYTNAELLDSREVNFDCDKQGVCKLSKADLEYIVGRDRLLTQMVEYAARQLRTCGGRGV